GESVAKAIDDLGCGLRDALGSTSKHRTLRCVDRARRQRRATTRSHHESGRIAHRIVMRIRHRTTSNPLYGTGRETVSAATPEAKGLDNSIVSAVYLLQEGYQCASGRAGAPGGEVV